MRLCVYALAAPGRVRLTAAGVEGEPIRRIRVGAVDVLIGTVQRAPSPTLTALKRYDHLMTSLWRRRITLLPVRFGTVVGDRSELEDLVREAEPDIARRLSAVRNRAQMTLRLPGAGQPGSRSHSRGRGRTHGRLSGSQYLEQRAAQSRSPEAEPLRAAVGRWVRTERVERRGGIVTVYHLIPRGAAERYRAAAARAGAAAGVPVMISGPYPPYAFSG